VRTEDLKAILAIRQAGSFSRAALALGLSQPAVSLAVKRVEDEFGLIVFDRSGSTVAVTADGLPVLMAIERILDTLGSLKSGSRADGFRIGLSPLFSGLDATRLVHTIVHTETDRVSVVFLDSDEIAGRSELDVRILVPALRRPAGLRTQFPTRWIGDANGVFIRSRKESAIWDRALHALLDHGVMVSRVIEVNDCGQAYHLAACHAGFTPCVMTPGNGFASHAVDGLPPLPPTGLDIFAEAETAMVLRRLLERDGSPDAAAHATPQAGVHSMPGPDA
jgi:DNA-binding transcriptional LysR family regulator